MPEIHLRHPRFSYSYSGPFTKNRERIQTSRETKDSRHIYQNELDKVCFQHDMAYVDFKDLDRRTFNIAKYSEFDRYHKFYDKKSSSGTAKSGTKNVKPSIR